MSTRFLPGDLPPKKLIEEVIRVNQAGEYGAKRIYEGQLQFTKNSDTYNIIKHMKEQEEMHLDYFNAKIADSHIRPTLLRPFWHIAGFTLGAITAMMGKKCAMLCTEAVEDVIDLHYQEQLKKLPATELELKNKINQFREEELEHKNTAVENDSQDFIAYKAFSKIIKSACKLAIYIAKKI